MPNAPVPFAGRVVWHLLVAADAARAVRFYCDLFGWRIDERPTPGGPYRLIVAGPGPIGGIVERTEVARSHWLPYVAVADVDAAAARSRALGGTILAPPADIPRTGRFAEIADPVGGVFRLYRGMPGSEGADPDVPLPGRVCWNELLARDDAAAQRFYGALFGWTEQRKDIGPAGPYRVQLAGAAQAGGIMRNPGNGAPDGWLLYFLAPDLANATARAKQLGAKPLLESIPIPDLGAFSLLRDPVGATFALFQRDA